MTFIGKLKAKKLLVGGLMAVTLSFSAGAFASVSAMDDQAAMHHSSQASHGVMASQNHGYGGHGYGGVNVDVHPNVVISISNAINTAVNVTINFVTNIFS